MTIKMTAKARKAAESLAVAYQAHHAAVQNMPAEPNSLIVWSRMLIESQEATGIELVRADRLLEHINWAQSEEGHQAAARGEV